MILTLLGILLLLLVITVGVAVLSFNRKIEKQKKALFRCAPTKVRDDVTSKSFREVITEADLDSFPPLMKNYLQQVGVVGQPKNCNVAFLQDGVIKTDSKKEWLSFKATQYISSCATGFIWKARAFPLFIVDSYYKGIGEVKVNLLGLKNMAVFSTPETNQSALGRYFGELLWFPMGFLDKDIRWETLDASTIKGIISKNQVSFEGYFHFSPDGLIHTFTGQRYRDTTLEDFMGKAEDYTLMAGLQIPKTIKAIWELDGGSLEYFRAEIGDYRISESIR